MNTVILIPARLGSSRLSGKPLAKIANKTMIMHVYDKAVKSGVGPVYVAAAEKEIYDEVVDNGGKAIMTDPMAASGTDRIYEAFETLTPKFPYIINLQGDLPTINPELIRKLAKLNIESDADISSLVSKITDKSELESSSVVKVALSAFVQARARALYFSRATIPHGATEHYHHIGIYGYKAEALRKFISLPQSYLEQAEKLEQLRALENGLHIDVELVSEAVLGVDTKEDLAKIRQMLD